MLFWERTLCQNIYHEMLDQVKVNLVEKQIIGSDEDIIHQLPQLFDLPIFSSIDDCLSFNRRIDLKLRQWREIENPDHILKIVASHADVLQVEISLIAFNKVLQIQHDMISFDIPIPQIRALVSQFMQADDFIDPMMA